MIDRICKNDCIWKNSPKHKQNPGEPCENEKEMLARREKMMPNYQERLKEWLS